MEVAPFSKTADDLEAVLEICRSAGISTRATRMEIALKRIREMDRLVAQYKREGRLASDLGGVRDVALLIEGSEFAELLPCLSRWLAEQPSVVKDKLRKVLGGPQVPTDENPLKNNNEARNFLFELTLGARFEARGTRVTQGEHPDFTVHLPRREIFVECKRPFSLAKLEDNIDGAAEQLRREFAQPGAGASTFGVIAIEASKVVNREYECFTFTNERQVQEGLSERLRQVIADTYAIRQPFRTQRIVAVIYRLSTVAHDRTNNRYVYAAQDEIVTLAQRGGTQRRAALDALARSLGLSLMRYRGAQAASA